TEAHAIWVGGPLGEDGDQASIRTYVASGAAANRADGWAFSIWTDVPRAVFEQADSTPPGQRTGLLQQAWALLAWARLHGVRLISIFEVFNAEHPMSNHAIAAQLLAAGTPTPFSAFSDVLRHELWAGVHVEGDNRADAWLTDSVRAALATPLGFGGNL